MGQLTIGCEVPVSPHGGTRTYIPSSFVILFRQPLLTMLSRVSSGTRNMFIGLPVWLKLRDSSLCRPAPNLIDGDGWGLVTLHVPRLQNRKAAGGRNPEPSLQGGTPSETVL